MIEFGFKLYLVFTVSWFLHLTNRLPVLGAVRFDLLMVIMLLGILAANYGTLGAIAKTDTSRIFKRLLLYIVLTLPFVEWPGSVVNNLSAFVKAILFYFFTIYFVTSEKKLKKFIAVFLACQSLRILEPLYLHLTQGYWGSFASMSGWQYMDRLAGAPSDVVNPNGLAFIVLTVIPFFYYLATVSRLNLLLAGAVIPLSLYTLILTGSRSGMVGLLIILTGILLKSRHKVVLLLLIAVGIQVGVAHMGENSRDRYASIYKSDTKNAGTAEGRIEGIQRDLGVAMRKPLFGHGLGTSREANANFGGVDQLSHNLYTEVAEELGFVGLALFIVLLKSIVSNSNRVLKEMKRRADGGVLPPLTHSMQVWLYMNLIFSFAAYGLSSYEWYLFAGLSVALRNIAAAEPVPVEERSILEHADDYGVPKPVHG